MNLKILKSILALLVVACSIGIAEETPTITVKKSGQVSVAFGSLSGEAADIVKRDLEQAGAFAIVPRERASYIINGGASGGGIQGTVADGGGSTVLSKNYSGGVRRAAHRFADDILETVTGTPGIAGSMIAFSATRSGRKEIYTCDYDGKNLRQLTHDNNISVGAALSADGSKLAYTGYKSGYPDIYVINVGSGARKRIVKFPGTNTGAAFSPNGRKIACSVSKDGNPELYVVSASGGGAKRLTRSRGVEASPTWSPDGKQIIYTSDDRGAPQLYRVSASGGKPSRLSTGYNFCTEPNWSPDGEKVAFNVRQGGGFGIAVMDLKRGGTRLLSTGGSAEDPVWGADSRHLIFVQSSNLYLLDAVSGKRVMVTSGLGKISEPTWTR